MPSEFKMSARKARAREHEMQALAMRKAGYTYQAIGDVLGMTDMGAMKCCRRVLDRIISKCSDDAAKVRELELQRLDEMHKALWPKAQEGNPIIIDRCLKIQERRAKLLGLDAATKMEHSGEVGVRQYVGVDVQDV